MVHSPTYSDTEVERLVDVAHNAFGLFGHQNVQQA